MSKIQSLIEELQFKKEKIEFLQTILENVKQYEHVSDKVREEVHALLNDFVEKTIVNIESGAASNNIEQSESLSKEEVDALKAVAQKVRQKTNNEPAKTQPQQPIAPVDPNQEVGPNEKMAFALQHRDLADKKVTVANDQNMTIGGVVTGLDAPFVVVKTDTGPTIKVPINKVSLA